MNIQISAGGVVYRREESPGALRIQMIRDRFGRMTVAKGKMEPGETVEQTALREIHEETGVHGTIVAPIRQTMYHYHDAQIGEVEKHVHYYLIEYRSGEQRPQLEEIGEVHWFSPQDAWRMQLAAGYRNNDDILRQALLMLDLQAVVVAGIIDHTYLKGDAGPADIERLCTEAITHSFYSVCVHSGWVPLCRSRLSGSNVRIAAVCGFPFGADATDIKALEAAWAVAHGADEIDMVLPIGRLLTGDSTYVEQDIRAVVQAAGDAQVKVIFETGYLNEAQIREACRLSEAAGAHFVKTSTGFGPGGATVDHIRLMRECVGERLRVKASGGVRDLQAALAMIEAGATRLGTSSGVAIVAASTTSISAGAARTESDY